MKQMTSTAIGLALLVGLGGIAAVAQNQSSSSSQNLSGGASLGDYARQIRKTPEKTTKPKVFDNDNLPKTDKLSVVGKTQPAPAQAEEAKPEDAASGEAKPATEAKAITTAPPKTEAQQDEAARQAAWKQWGDKITAQKEQVDLLQREVDVLQREYQIRAAAMYADAGNRLRNSADWDKQDAQYRQQIADKQKAVEEAKEKLSDLQDQATKAGMPSSVTEQ